ncbi:MAG: serine/threonine-protein kinase [Kofleriaceae bacterium]
METFGTWRLESLIAVGGLGEVWRANREGTTAAVKRLHTHLMRNEQVLAQFATERQLTTTLPHHPHLVHAIDAGDVDGRPFIAMELAPGEDVRRLLAPAPNPRDGSPAPVVLPRSRAIAIMVAACEALSHLHGHGWVHGDLNPGNVIVDDADHVMVVDLGVARAIGEAGEVRGTHAYMAPEQIRGERWTPATDVFALGVMLWELIANARLFHRGPPWLTMAAVVEAPAPPLADPALDAIARAALDKDPVTRTHSAAQLRDALTALA